MVFGNSSTTRDALRVSSKSSKVCIIIPLVPSRFEGLESSEFIPDRGLREGCPSSPILFNIYHHGIMEVFRARRARMALGLNAVPGVWWVSKVDGKIGKRRNDRIKEGRHLKRQLIGTLHMQMTQASLGKQMKSAKRKNFFP